MRSLLAVLVLAASTLAAPTNGPQLVMSQVDPEATLQIVQGAQTGVHPHEHGHGVIETNQTIYMYLSQQLRYTKLVKLIDWDEEYVTVLNATTDSITFFAPDNKALAPPKKGGHHSATLSLATVYEQYERLTTNARVDDDDDEEKKKRFKKILRALLKYHTLPMALDKPALYANVTYATALKAKDGSYDGQPRRISVSTGFLGKLTINFYVPVEWTSVTAENGYIHGVERPILPPPSILDELFFIDDFSTLTSALQKVGLEDELQWRFKKSSETEGGGPVVSLFAPNNWAFKRLPMRLRLYLFSPAGEKVLKRLLQYHIVPDFILNSDWVHDAASDDGLRSSKAEVTGEECEGADWYTDSKASAFPAQRSKKNKKTMRKSKKAAKKVSSAIRLFKDGTAEEAEIPKPCFKSRWMMSTANTWPPHEYPHITVNITVPTLLEDHSLRFVVGKAKTSLDLMGGHDEFVTAVWPRLVRSYVFVNGRPTGPEGVARNGAIYAISRLLHPFKKHSDLDGDENEGDDSWDDWEEWLPAWGEQ